ncbi:MAG: DUF2270 domain-containing protein [Anaerolineales bacterium]|nr:DUF2270 domain-containing protein [Anaerolineales bacterium]
MADLNPPPGGPAPKTPPTAEPVWTFRGYGLRSSEFTTAMVHFYRGELQRSNTWRTRLDNTTNWAVVTTGAAISFALSDPAHHFGVIILNTLLVTLFLWIEARRYRYYELWSRRVRLMETDFFAAMLVPPFAPSPEWAENLAETLLNPDFPISMWEAFGRRFRRNFVWIYIILGLAWALKSYLHPVPAMSWAEFMAHSALGPIPGWVVLLAGLIYNGALLAIGLFTAGLTQASGEVLPKFGEFPVLSGLWQAMETHEAHNEGGAMAPKPGAPAAAPRAAYGRRRQQLLALIIASKPQAVADRILKDLRRGATALHGKGMYTQQEREVLLVAVTVTEMNQLKALVNAEDPNAFVIVSPAREVLGRGFQPLTH